MLPMTDLPLNVQTAFHPTCLFIGVHTLVWLAQAEYEAQGTESIGEAAGRVVLLPTVIINNKQYRGRLDTVSITKALCAGFDETTEPEVMHFNTCRATAIDVVLVCSQPVVIRSAAALHSDL